MNNDEIQWSVEVDRADIVGSVQHRVYALMAKNHLKESDIKAVALGPNEFNALRFQMCKQQRLPDISLANPTEMKLMWMNVYCMGRPGIELLVDSAWHVQIAECRKHLDVNFLGG